MWASLPAQIAAGLVSDAAAPQFHDTQIGADQTATRGQTGAGGRRQVAASDRTLNRTALERLSVYGLVCFGVFEAGLAVTRGENGIPESLTGRRIIAFNAGQLLVPLPLRIMLLFKRMSTQPWLRPASRNSPEKVSPENTNELHISHCGARQFLCDAITFCLASHLGSPWVFAAADISC